MMNPVVKGRKKSEIRQFPLFCCWLNLLLIFGVDVVHGSGDDLAAKAYPDNLAL